MNQSNSQKPKRGRPTNLEKARRAELASSVDPASVDPVAVLQRIAGNPFAPAAARVSAAKALLAIKPVAQPSGEAEGEDIPRDALSRKAFDILNDSSKRTH